jgi:octaprenyl-diphosphate synthase
MYTRQIQKTINNNFKPYCKGKLIRSNLICYTGSALNIDGIISEDVLKFAAQMEILHNATLLHDDVLDDEDIRRGSESFNKTLGNKKSILIGDCMLANVSYEVSQFEKVEIMKNIAIILKCFGKGELEQNNYFYKAANKTAFFFAYILDSVIVLENISDPHIRRSFFEFGKTYGMYFQYVDDYLDYEKDEVNNTLNLVSQMNGDKSQVSLLISYTFVKSLKILKTIPNTEQMQKYIKTLHDGFFK